jgi:hypothetical protein
MALQAKRIGMTSQIVTQDAMFQPKFMEVAKDAAEGVYLTYGFTDKTTPEYKAFEKIYVPKYGPSPPTPPTPMMRPPCCSRPSRTPVPPTRPKSRPRS